MVTLRIEVYEVEEEAAAVVKAAVEAVMLR